MLAKPYPATAKITSRSTEVPSGRLAHELHHSDARAAELDSWQSRLPTLSIGCTPPVNSNAQFRWSWFPQFGLESYFGTNVGYTNSFGHLPPIICGSGPKCCKVSIYEIDDGALVAIEETDELPEFRGRHIVVDRVEIAVIGDVERVYPQPDVMPLSILSFQEGHAK